MTTPSMFHKWRREPEDTSIHNRDAITLKEELQYYENGGTSDDLANKNDNYQCAAGEDIPDECLGLSYVSMLEYGAPNAQAPLWADSVSARLGLDKDLNPLPKNDGPVD